MPPFSILGPLARPKKALGQCISTQAWNHRFLSARIHGLQGNQPVRLRIFYDFIYLILLIAIFIKAWVKKYLNRCSAALSHRSRAPK